MTFRILTIGWEPYFINDLLAPIEVTGIDFVHGLVGDASRIARVQAEYPSLKVVSLSKSKDEPLPEPDYELLASLESIAVPTIRSMVQGDRVLRYRPEREALGYATLLANRIAETLKEFRPNLVLASHDSIHSAMSLAVAKSLGIPWVALAFPVIPADLTGFCNALTPDSLVPIVRPVDEPLLARAKSIMHNVRSKQQKVVAYRAPASLSQWVKQYLHHGSNLVRRKRNLDLLGIDRFTYHSAGERFLDVARRSFNRLLLPTKDMLAAPPQGPFIYFPFHMSPESMLDTWAPFYQDQIAFVSQMALAVPADTEIVIKLHFSDPDNYTRSQLQKLMKFPSLHIAHPNAPGSAFLEKAALVIGIHGTSCIEASLLGKPVLIFGDSPYQHFPRSERALRPDLLYGQIRRMLDLPPATDDEIEAAYAAYLARYMPGRINDWSQPVEPEQLERYAECFRSLRLYLEDSNNYKNWYQQQPFVGSYDS